jgi:hypothetical protein
MENKRGKHIIKKSEMRSDIEYILCPNSECDIYFNLNRWCFRDCPSPKEAKVLYYCSKCKKITHEVSLKDYYVGQRYDHLCKHDGMEFLVSRFYINHNQIIHEYPKDE